MNIHNIIKTMKGLPPNNLHDLLIVRKFKYTNKNPPVLITLDMQELLTSNGETLKTRR